MNAVVSDEEWTAPELMVEFADVSALLVRKSDLLAGFSANGQLTGTVNFIVTGESALVSDVMNSQALHHTLTGGISGHTRLLLIPVVEC